MVNIGLVYSTFATQEDAKSVLKNLMREELATCGNIFTPHIAIYPWKGDVCEEQEVAVLFKTSQQNLEGMILKLREIHPYELPCILELSAKSLPDYGQWLIEN